jgi:hypothetical protein
VAPTKRVRFLAFTAAALALIAIGCGGGGGGNGVASKSANEIVTAATKAANGAGYAHVVGDLSSGGSPLTLDLYLQAGKGGRGKISEKGLSFEVIVVGSITYIKGNSSFYKHIGGNAAAQLFQGKWLKAPSTSGELAQLGALADLHELINKELSSHGTLAKGSTTTIGGQRAIAVRDITKGGTLYVAVTGKPFPIEITKSGAEAGVIRFEEWNKPVSIKAPSDAIDLAQLEAAAKH